MTNSPNNRRRHVRRGVTMGVLCAGGILRPVGAQATGTCDAAHSVSAASAQGRRITAISIQTAGPSALPGGFRPPLHITTRTRTIESKLLFAVGDTLETTRVEESLRALQRLKFLDGARIAVSCDTAGDVSVSVTTHDRWSARAGLAIRSEGRTSLSVQESNLLGTGRAARVGLRTYRGALGVLVSYEDPTLLHDRVVASLSDDFDAYGTTWRAGIRSRDDGLFALWRIETDAVRSVRSSVPSLAFASGADSVRRLALSTIVARRLWLNERGATFLLLGGESERATVVANHAAPMLGPALVRRSMLLADVGLAHRSARLADARDLEPRSGTDLHTNFDHTRIALGTEFEAIVGVGPDFLSRGLATHVDAWIGRVSMLGHRSNGASDSSAHAFLSTGAWLSGYHSAAAGGLTAGTLRLALDLRVPQRHGMWITRVAAERLADPDPDVRTLALSDPALASIPRSRRLAESALSASIERSIPLRQLRGRYELDLAAFGVASARWDAASLSEAFPRHSIPSVMDPTGFRPTFDTPVVESRGTSAVGTFGLGLRLVPATIMQSTIRLDVGVPWIATKLIPRRPYVGLTIVAGFGALQHRAKAHLRAGRS